MCPGKSDTCGHMTHVLCWCLQTFSVAVSGIMNNKVASSQPTQC